MGIFDPHRPYQSSFGMVTFYPCNRRDYHYKFGLLLASHEWFNPLAQTG
jgi:hypothetical protein